MSVSSRPDLQGFVIAGNRPIFRFDGLQTALVGCVQPLSHIFHRLLFDSLPGTQARRSTCLYHRQPGLAATNLVRRASRPASKHS